MTTENPPEIFDAIITTIKNYAEQILADSELATQIITFASDGDIITITGTTGDSEQNLHVLHTLANGIPCYAMVWFADTYCCVGPQFEKSDGTDWEPGEMDYAWENNTPDKQYLSEAVLVVYRDIDGREHFANLLYRRDGDQFTWTDDLEKGVMKGSIIHAIRHGMDRHKDLEEYIYSKAEEFDLDHDDVHDYVIATTMLYVSERYPVVHSFSNKFPELKNTVDAVFQRSDKVTDYTIGHFAGDKVVHPVEIDV